MEEFVEVIQHVLLIRSHLGRLVDRPREAIGLSGSQRVPAQKAPCVVTLVLLLPDGLAHGLAELVGAHMLWPSNPEV